MTSHSYFLFSWKPLFCTVVMSFVLSTGCAAADTWELIGKDPLVDQSRIYIKRDAIKYYGEGNFYVTTLSVYPTTSKGITFFDDEGNPEIDDRYPHRSLVETSIYDCKRRMSAVGHTYYFSGNKPLEADLVYTKVEDQMIFVPELVRDPVYDAVCN